jgi:FlaA1/EpsC-like NDP-sugar epimerase
MSLASRGSSLRRLLPGDAPATALAIVEDLLVVGAAYTLALLLRFDAEVPGESVDFALRVVPLIAVVYAGANVLFGVYRTIWSYGSLDDIVGLFRPVAFVTAVAFIANFFLRERDMPQSVVLSAGALTFTGMAVVKMRTRLLRHMPWSGATSRRLLIVGAGHTGQALARQLQNSPGLAYQPIGYVDDDPRKRNRRMHGLRVFGDLGSLEKTITEHSADAVAIAIPRAPGTVIRGIVSSCQALDIPVRIVPAVERWLAGAGSEAMRDITLDDLLGREPVAIDYSACSESVRDRVVLVTGAAGSIGSELVRQVLAFQPRELHLLDNNETGLHDLQLEVAGISPETVLRAWVANIADGDRIDVVFNRVRPQVVYHAAAFKHVPLMEHHPDEAFRVNVLGTRNLALAARHYETGLFVLVSTDKAVRPTSIMGATKRIAELLVLSLAGTERTRFVAVRFGNVMGSRGSVVPIFMRQIELGGPVTVMHPDMMRYFISIPEAVSLVIQAGTFGGRGKIYMLDMGEEVNILELAERMIRLRGLRPGKDIEVVFTGPRPGEKLREELVADFERLEATEHPKVNRLSADVDVTESEINRLIGELESVVHGDPGELRRRIHLVARRYSLEAGATAAAEELTPA